MYTLWLPERYRTECRASAFAFATSVGRFVGAGITFLVGAGVAHFGKIGVPVALTSLSLYCGFGACALRRRDARQAAAGLRHRALTQSRGFAQAAGSAHRLEFAVGECPPEPFGGAKPEAPHPPHTQR